MTIDITKIKDIIAIIPLLIIYILPGYMFIETKNFIINKKVIDDKNLIIKSILISYIIVKTEELLVGYIPNVTLDISSAKFVVITFLISIFLGYTYTFLVNYEPVKNVVRTLNINRSFETDILAEVVDFKLGMWVRVFIKAEEIIYVGKLRKYEQISDSVCHVVLSNIIIYDYLGNELENRSQFNTEWVMICLKDNYRIELCFDSTSKKILN